MRSWIPASRISLKEPDRSANAAPLRPLDVKVPATLLALILLACFLGPVIPSLPDPVGGQVAESNLPMLSPGHVLGTDTNGNDSLSRLLHGGRASLQIAIIVNLLGLVLGGLIGAASAYAGRIAESIVMRGVDILIAFPSLVLALGIGHALGPSHASTSLALTSISVPAFARVARAATLQLREQPFMLAAKISGTTTFKVLLCHVAPNAAPQLISFGLLGIGITTTIEGALSYLGLGIPLPYPSWGNMIFEGHQSFLARPTLIIMPGSLLVVTVACFNLLAEALRRRWVAG